MGNSKYIPTSDADKGIWLNSFTLKMAVYSTTLGITPAELAALQKDNTMFQYIISSMDVFRQYLINLATYKNMLKHAVNQQHIGAYPVLPTLPAVPPTVTEGLFDRVAKMVSRIKASANYTDAIGADLGIIAPAVTIDITNLQPFLKITLDVGKPHIKWVKGVSDSLDLFVNRNDGAGFTLIGRLTRNEYLDTVSLPSSKVYDEWQYKGIYVIADTQVGLFSLVVSVDVKRV